jgi:hypothetical protein
MNDYAWLVVIVLGILFIYSKGKTWLSNLPLLSGNLPQSLQNIMPTPGQGGSGDPTPGIPATSGQSGDPSMPPDPFGSFILTGNENQPSTIPGTDIADPNQPNITGIDVGPAGDP